MGQILGASHLKCWSFCPEIRKLSSSIPPLPQAGSFSSTAQAAAVAFLIKAPMGCIDL